MTSQSENYGQLKSQVEELKTDILQGQKVVKELLAQHLKLEEFFQIQVLNSGSGSSDISYYVEINKQLRLLGSDLAMLRVAKIPDTIAQRQKQAIARLDLLVNYCDALLRAS